MRPGKKQRVGGEVGMGKNGRGNKGGRKGRGNGNAEEEIKVRESLRRQAGRKIGRGCVQRVGRKEEGPQDICETNRRG